MLYFAYGSNLNLADLNRWCCERNETGDFLEFHSAGILRDYATAFTLFSNTRSGGVLDVVPSDGAVAPGALFTVVREEGWRLLDIKEGVPTHYVGESVEVLLPDGSTTQATTYSVVADRRKDHVVPNQHYVDVVCEGLSQLGMDDSHILAAVEKGA